jgi:hypothetical protein
MDQNQVNKYNLNGQNQVNDGNQGIKAAMPNIPSKSLVWQTKIKSF